MQTMTYYRDFKNLVIDGSPDYQRSIAEQLDKVWGTWTGWAVLRGIIDSGKTVRIVPFSAADQKTWGAKNAFAQPTSGRDGSPRGFRTYAGGTDDPNTRQDERFQLAGYEGTGKGSDAEVHFSLQDRKVMPTCSKTVTSNCLPPMFAQNQGPDDTLVHELVHALRQMRGQWTVYPTRTKGYDNEEEYFAILVQNTHASEQGLTILRRDHRGYSALKSSLSTSETFLGKAQRPLSMEQLENRLLVQKFNRENHELCKNIAGRVTAKFNPIGEYLRNPTLYLYDPTLAWGAPERA